MCEGHRLRLRAAHHVARDLAHDACHEVAVPLGAITDRGSGPGVWVLAPGGSAVRFRPVRVDKMETEDALLSGGLKAGETVVALGAHLLTDGEHVRVAAQTANQEVATNE